MSRINCFRGRYIHPEDFRDLRRSTDLTRKQTADLLDVPVRTVQNWEAGGAHTPRMVHRMLSIQTVYGLTGKTWENWTVHEA